MAENLFRFANEQTKVNKINHESLITKEEEKNKYTHCLFMLGKIQNLCIFDALSRLQTKLFFVQVARSKMVWNGWDPSSEQATSQHPTRLLQQIVVPKLYAVHSHSRLIPHHLYVLFNLFNVDVHSSIFFIRFYIVQ